jgi:hypothetical protein
MLLLAMRGTKETQTGMSSKASAYEERINEANTVASEVAFIDAVQRLVDFGNEHILKNFQIELIMKEQEGR